MIDVIFEHAFDHIGISEEKLEPSLEPTFGFNNKGSTPMGQLKLLVQMGILPCCETFETLFVVMDQPSYYNAFFKRTALDEINAFVSPKYLMLKFLAKKG